MQLERNYRLHLYWRVRTQAPLSSCAFLLRISVKVCARAVAHSYVVSLSFFKLAILIQVLYVILAKLFAEV